MLTFYFLSNNQGFLHGVLDGRQLPIPAKYARAFYSGKLQRRQVTADEVAWQEGARQHQGAILARKVPVMDVVYAQAAPMDAPAQGEYFAQAPSQGAAPTLLPGMVSQARTPDINSKVQRMRAVCTEKNRSAMRDIISDYTNSGGDARAALVNWGYSPRRATELVDHPAEFLTGYKTGSGESTLAAVAEALGYEVIIDFRRKAE